MACCSSKPIDNTAGGASLGLGVLGVLSSLPALSCCLGYQLALHIDAEWLQAPVLRHGCYAALIFLVGCVAQHSLVQRGIKCFLMLFTGICLCLLAYDLFGENSETKRQGALYFLAVIACAGLSYGIVGRILSCALACLAAFQIGAMFSPSYWPWFKML